MKTITQRAREYSNYTACKGEREAFTAGAISIIEELKTVMSVSEDKYLRDNIQKMINFLETTEWKDNQNHRFELLTK